MGIFALGQNAQEVSKGMEQLKLYGEAGHVTANHSYSHYRLSKVSASTFIQDIQRAHQLLSPYLALCLSFAFLISVKDKMLRKEQPSYKL